MLNVIVIEVIVIEVVVIEVVVEVIVVLIIRSSIYILIRYRIWIRFRILFWTFLGEVKRKAIAPTASEAKIVPMVLVRDISVFMTTL